MGDLLAALGVGVFGMLYGLIIAGIGLVVEPATVDYTVSPALRQMALILFWAATGLLGPILYFVPALLGWAMDPACALENHTTNTMPVLILNHIHDQIIPAVAAMNSAVKQHVVQLKLHKDRILMLTGSSPRVKDAHNYTWMREDLYGDTEVIKIVNELGHMGIPPRHWKAHWDSPTR